MVKQGLGIRDLIQPLAASQCTCMGSLPKPVPFWEDRGIVELRPIRPFSPNGTFKHESQPPFAASFALRPDRHHGQSRGPRLPQLRRPVGFGTAVGGRAFGLGTDRRQAGPARHRVGHDPGKFGDWSIFRRTGKFRDPRPGRKHGPVPFGSASHRPMLASRHFAGNLGRRDQTADSQKITPAATSSCRPIRAE